MILWLIFCYLLGSIPVAKWIGCDGLGFYGSSEIWRKYGWKKSAIVGTSDFLKGFIAVSIASYFHFPVLFILLSGLLATTGQMFSVFNRMRGGGGLLTTYGSLFVASPLIATIMPILVIPLIPFKKAHIGVFLSWIITGGLNLVTQNYLYTFLVTGHFILVIVSAFIRKHE